MNGLIRFSLGNWHAIVVAVLTIVLIGALILGATLVPIDILPVNNSPAVQVLTFYGGMPATNVKNDITNRMERWTGQAAGTARQESRSITGVSIVRNFYRGGTDPNGALTQVNSLASAAIPNLPPGTLPPVILPFDPTGTTPVCLVALDWTNPPSNYSERRVDPVRHGSLRGPQLHHGRPGSQRAGRLWRPAADRPRLHEPRDACRRGTCRRST